MCCGVLQCVAVCLSFRMDKLKILYIFRNVLQCAAVCCSVLQRVAVCSSSFRVDRSEILYICVVVCCSVLHCVAVCCSMLQCAHLHLEWTEYTGRTSLCVTWLENMRDMTHSYVRHDSFIRETWLIHMCDMTHSCVWHDSFICVIWLIHVGDKTL